MTGCADPTCLPARLEPGESEARHFCRECGEMTHAACDCACWRPLEVDQLGRGLLAVYLLTAPAVPTPTCGCCQGRADVAGYCASWQNCRHDEPAYWCARPPADPIPAGGALAEALDEQVRRYGEHRPYFAREGDRWVMSDPAWVAIARKPWQFGAEK